MSELVTDYLDGALPLRVRLQARLHLFLCRACVQYYDQMRKTVRLLAGVRVAPLDSETERRLLDAVAHRGAGGSAPPRGDISAPPRGDASAPRGEDAP